MLVAYSPVAVGSVSGCCHPTDGPPAADLPDVGRRTSPGKARLDFGHRKGHAPACAGQGSDPRRVGSSPIIVQLSGSSPTYALPHTSGAAVRAALTPPLSLFQSLTIDFHVQACTSCCLCIRSDWQSPPNIKKQVYLLPAACDRVLGPAVGRLQLPGVVRNHLYLVHVG